MQYSRSSAGPWVTIESFSTPLGGAFKAPNGKKGSWVKLAVFAKLASAYYRVHFLASPGYDAADSKAVLAWLYETKVTSVSVSPGSVPYGGTATVTCRLWRAPKVSAQSWKAYGGRTLKVLYHLKGKKTWYLLGPVKTNAAGWFKLKFYAYKSLVLAAIYLGDKTHLWSSGGSAVLTVTGSHPGSARTAGRCPGACAAAGS